MRFIPYGFNQGIHMNWQQKIVAPDVVMKKIKPGMSIFLGTGVSEPRTLVNCLMKSDYHNLADLELIQLVNFSDTISLKTLDSHKYRFKTFSFGNMMKNAITQGLVDLIPTLLQLFRHEIDGQQTFKNNF